MLAYGTNDSSYQAADQLVGIEKLVTCFYHLMDTLPEAKVIRAMHADDLSLSEKKLQYFLSGWLGGPKLYAKTFGSINIPSAHCHMPIGKPESNAWLLCMDKAIEQQPFSECFKTYLKAQFRIPVKRIQQACKKPV